MSLLEEGALRTSALRCSFTVEGAVDTSIVCLMKATGAAGTSTGQRRVAHLGPTVQWVSAVAMRPLGRPRRKSGITMSARFAQRQSLVADSVGLWMARRSGISQAGPDRRRPRGHGRLAVTTRGLR